MSNIVVVMRGQESIKSIGQFKHSTIPFLGVDHQKEGSQLVVGLLFPYEDKKPLCSETNRLVTAWRTFRFLEMLPSIKETDSVHSNVNWPLNFISDLQRNEAEYDKKERSDSFGITALQFAQILEFLKKEILPKGPTGEEIQTIIQSMRAKEELPHLDLYELESESSSGKISRLPCFEAIFKNHYENRQRYNEQMKEWEKIAEAPPPPDKDLELLFLDLKLGLTQFSQRGEAQRPIRELNRSVLERILPPINLAFSLGCYWGRGILTYPEFEKASERYLFLSVSFEGGKVLIKTRVETFHQDETSKRVVYPVHGKYTIPELREKIGIPIQ